MLPTERLYYYNVYHLIFGWKVIFRAITPPCMVNFPIYNRYPRNNNPDYPIL